MSEKSPIKTNLKISLFAGNQLVAESDDPILWQSVLSSITRKASTISSSTTEPPALGEQTDDDLSGYIQKFAQQIGVDSDHVVGACSPSLESPYLHLDMHYWEAMKRNTPSRGPAAISNIAAAATLLCLWFKVAKMNGLPTAKNCKDVLDTIGIQEANPTRSLTNTSWLQSRSNGVVINPAEASKAIDFAKLYCSKTKISK